MALVFPVNTKAAVKFDVGDTLNIRGQLRELVNNQYSRNDTEIARGRFRMKGDVLEIGPAYEDRIVELTFWRRGGGDSLCRPHHGRDTPEPEAVSIYPAKHFVFLKNGWIPPSALFTETMEQLDCSMEKASAGGAAARAAHHDLEMLGQVWLLQWVEITLAICRPGGRHSSGVPDRLFPGRLAADCG